MAGHPRHTASEMFSVPSGYAGRIRRRGQGDHLHHLLLSGFGLAISSASARRSGCLYQEYFDALPGIRDYMNRPRPLCASTVMSKRSSAAASTSAREGAKRGPPRLRERQAINAPFKVQPLTSPGAPWHVSSALAENVLTRSCSTGYASSCSNEYAQANRSAMSPRA